MLQAPKMITLQLRSTMILNKRSEQEDVYHANLEYRARQSQVQMEAEQISQQKKEMKQLFQIQCVFWVVGIITPYQGINSIILFSSLKFKFQQLLQHNLIYKLMDQQKKMEAIQIKEWKQQWRIQSRKVDQGEKAYSKFLTVYPQSNPQSASKIHSIISEHQLSSKRADKQSQLVFGKLKKINENIEQLKEVLKYFDRTHQSLMKVQKLSEGIFGKMQSLKNQMANSYDELDQNQRKISNDLELINRRVQCFDNEQFEEQQQQVFKKKQKNKQNQGVANNKKIAKAVIEQDEGVKTKLSIIEDKLKAKQEQVEKADQEMRQLGKNLGWHEQDHKDFITIWNRNQGSKNYFQIQQQLIEYFKMYTNQQIIEHMNRYMKVKKLTEKKKSLILQYKQLKEEKKQEEIQILKANEQQKQLKIKKQQQIRLMEQQQKQMKEKVQLWKKQKEEQKAQQKRRMLENQQKKKNEQMLKRKEQEMKRKEVLDKWKQEQQQKKQEQSKLTQSRPRSALHSNRDKETISRIKQRQEQIIREKMQRAIQKKMQEQEKFKKIQKIKQQKLIKFAHVNSKLDEKTTAIKQKEREKFDGKDRKDANTFGGQILMTGMRAIPSWRQGL